MGHADVSKCNLLYDEAGEKIGVITSISRQGDDLFVTGEIDNPKAYEEIQKRGAGISIMSKAGRIEEASLVIPMPSDEPEDKPTPQWVNNALFLAGGVVLGFLLRIMLNG